MFNTHFILCLIKLVYVMVAVKYDIIPIYSADGETGNEYIEKGFVKRCGKCAVYVYSRNGLAKKVSVTVK